MWICMVADPGAVPESVLAGRMRAAVRAGVDIIQIRDPAGDAAALLRAARAAVAAAGGTATRVIVNDRLDVALAAPAHGIHLRADSFAAPEVRRLAPPGFLVGRSVHSDAEAAAAARAGGCDYLLFGTVFESGSKPSGHRTAGPGALRRVCALADLPVLAIGGITEETAGEAMRAGAAGVAGIGIFRQERDITEVVRRLRQAGAEQGGVG